MLSVENHAVDPQTFLDTQATLKYAWMSLHYIQLQNIKTSDISSTLIYKVFFPPQIKCKNTCKMLMEHVIAIN